MRSACPLSEGIRFESNGAERLDSKFARRIERWRRRRSTDTTAVGRCELHARVDL